MAEVSWVSFDLLTPFVKDVFKGIGVPQEDALICTDVLMDADLKGLDTHGVNRLKPVYYDRVKAGLQKPVTQLEVLREGPTTAVLDANNGMGMVAAKRSMDLCIKKARKMGIAMVVIRNSTHFGIAGYYTEIAAKKGFVGICGTNARPSVAPTFGVEPMFGTNPLSFAFPTDEKFPFSLDCATSIIQRGKVELYARQGNQLPPGLVITRDGSSKTDPDIVLHDLLSGNAALLPLGGAGEDTAGYKGYGYATVVEVLSAGLQSGYFLKGITGVNLGHFFIAVNISEFTELQEFKNTAGEILRSLRSAEKEPGVERIYTAGEKEYLVSLIRGEKGVPVNHSVQRELTHMRNELGLTSYQFPFE